MTPDQARACKWWELHQWTAWTEARPGVKTGLTTGNKFDVMVQSRKCNRCGLEVLRECQ